MSLAGQPNLQYSSGDRAAEKAYAGLPLWAWVRVGVITLLFCLTYWTSLRRLWLKTNPFNGEPNWSHSVLIPIVGLYYLFLNRDDLLRAKVKPAWSGVVILIAGLAIFTYGIWPGQNDFTKDIGLVVTIFGVTLLCCGWGVMKTAWFPIVFLFCALPWPGLMYSRVAGPLQTLAAKVAVFVLQITGVNAEQVGTKIAMGGGFNKPPDRVLNVAEACAGMRSLMTFISVATAFAFLSQRPLWQKLILSFSGIPIAIFCNVMRVAGQGELDHWVSQEWSEGFAHQFVGVVMLVPAFFLIMGVAWLLDKIFVEEAETPASRKTKTIVAAGRTPPVSPAKPMTPNEIASAPRRRATTRPDGGAS